MNLNTEQFEKRLLEKTESGDLVWEYHPERFESTGSCNGIAGSVGYRENFSLVIGGFSLKLFGPTNEDDDHELMIHYEDPPKLIILNGAHRAESLKALFLILQDSRGEERKLQEQAVHDTQQNVLDELSHQLA